MSRISGSSRASKLMTRAGDGSTLSLDFTTGVLDPRITFTRTASTCSFINSQGFVEIVTAANIPRFNYDSALMTPRGLLIEQASTNLQRYSEAFTAGTYWGYNATTPTTESSDINPKGTTGSISFAPSSNGGSRFLGAFATGLTTSSFYTFSIWLKAKGTANAEFIAFNSSGTISSNIVILSQPLGASAVVSNTPGIVPRISGLSSTGWTRVAITTSAALGGTGTGNFFIYPDNTSSQTTAQSLFVWGAQLEAGISATSYIPTTTNTVLRQQDNAIIAAGTAFNDWYTGGLNGTFFADWYGGVAGASGTQRTVLATDDVTNKHLHLFQAASATGTGVMTLANQGGGSSISTSNGITSAGARSKSAFSYATSAMNICLNNGTVASGTVTGFTVAPTWLSLGGQSTSGTAITGTTTMLNSSIRAIKYWPTVLPNTTLQSLTA